MTDDLMCGCHAYVELAEKDVELNGMKYDRYKCPNCGAEKYILRG